VSAEEDVLEANRRFYRALTDLDFPAMASCWLEEPWVQCVHPGWPMLRGWDDVMESWKRIFDNTASLQVSPDDVSVRLFGELAWVLCLEHIAAPSSAGSIVSFAQSTNLYLSTSSGWRMVLHHASVLPVEGPPEPTQMVH
jgi:ketosteroid isomerase-like protein